MIFHEKKYLLKILIFDRSINVHMLDSSCQACLVESQSIQARAILGARLSATRDGRTCGAYLPIYHCGN